MKSILVIALALISFKAFSQKLEFGVLAGIGKNTTGVEEFFQDTTTLTDSKNLFAYTAGAFLRKETVKNFYLEADLSVSMKAFKHFYHIDSARKLNDFTLKIFYLELPLIAHLKIIPGVWIGAGYHQGITLTNSFHDLTLDRKGKASNMIVYNDRGLLLDGRVRISEKWGAGLRYTHSITAWNTFLRNIVHYRHRSGFIYAYYRIF